MTNEYLITLNFDDAKTFAEALKILELYFCTYCYRPKKLTFEYQDSRDWQDTHEIKKRLEEAGICYLREYTIYWNRLNANNRMY